MINKLLCFMWGCVPVNVLEWNQKIGKKKTWNSYTGCKHCGARK